MATPVDEDDDDDNDDDDDDDDVDELFSQFWSGLETVRTASAVLRSSCSATTSDALW